ncbi:hypothetical protein [Streptomyces sp. bgisy154]|uniref:hypothetical protein n=1 Tax=Streptomyces sp. bgisy154 TaxID=3413794 RepID=UPI003D72569A
MRKEVRFHSQPILAPRFVRTSMVSAIVLSGILTATACSTSSGGDGERNYTIPSTQCGISLNPELISPFLPGGDSITVKPSSPNGGTKRCDVIVDGKLAIREIQSWWSNGERVTTVAEAYDKTANGEVAPNGRVLFSDVGAVGKTAAYCTSVEHPDQTLFTVIQVFTSGRSDSAAMKRLVTSYTQSVENSAECR